MHANGFAISAKEKKSRRLLLLKRSVPLYLLILPSLILLIVFTYIPMYGVTIAFKAVSYTHLTLPTKLEV